MFLIYWLLVLITIDTFFFIAVTAVWSLGLPYIAAPVLVYLVLLYVRRKRGWFSFLTATQMTLVPIAVASVSLLIPNMLGGMPCVEAARQPGIRVIGKDFYTNVPRFIVSRPEHGDVLVGDRMRPFPRSPAPSDAIRSVDRETGRTVTWLKKGEPMSIARDPMDGDVYAIVGSNFKDPPGVGSPKMMFYRFSPDGIIKNRISMGLPRSSYYIANLV